MGYLGVDLAWRDQAAGQPANESGVVAIDGHGVVLDAGWTRGVSSSLAWADHTARREHALMFVDAPLVVDNDSGQRLCETQVGQRYGRWKVSANSTNRQSPRLAGVHFLRQAQTNSAWRYCDGRRGPSRSGRAISETYPYTVLVGAHELGYANERPRYVRKPPHTPVAVPVQDAKWLRPGNRVTSPTSARIRAAPAGPMPWMSIMCDPVARTRGQQRSGADDAAAAVRPT